MAAAVSVVAGKPEALKEKPLYSDIYEKNIFDPKRRPWSEKVASPPQPARQPVHQPDPQLELTKVNEPPAPPAPPVLAPEPLKPGELPKLPSAPLKQAKPSAPAEPPELFGPPPPPPVPPLTVADAEVYGVMLFGDYRKVLLKLGAGFKFAPQPKNKTAPRPFITVGIGESLGPYTLKEITDTAVIFESVDGQSPLVFNQRKGDRPVGGPVSPMAQAPVILPAPAPTMVHGSEPAVAAAQPPAATPGAPGAQPAAAPGAQPAAAAAEHAAAAAAPETVTAGFEAPPQPVIQGRTLLEAIQAAQQAQKANPNAPPPVNPFAPK